MKTVVSLSGGLDSTTVLAWALANGHEVQTVGFRYGSKHNPFENALAANVAAHYGVPFQLIDLTPAMSSFKSDLLTSGGDIPEGHYEDASMSQTVVPGRNMIFISLLAGLAWSQGAGQVAVGIHQGDHAIYEDCRTEFFKAMDAAVYLGTGGRVQLLAPFLSTDKSGITRWGLAHGVPYHMTRTCYKAQEIACGKCGSCQERLQGFNDNGFTDPLRYEA